VQNSFLMEVFQSFSYLLKYTFDLAGFQLNPKFVLLLFFLERLSIR
jgi:hypothetical protein